MSEETAMEVIIFGVAVYILILMILVYWANRLS
jgi:Na+-transporting methylmalonyl-CoA/oxaloacetate decarboxylase gamma subunit